MESFWGTLKNELIHHRRYCTRAQAMQEIIEYIGLFYNRQESKLALATDHLPHSHSDIMKSNLLLNPLDVTIASRPHNYRLR